VNKHYFVDILHDTLVLPQQPQTQPLPNIAVPKPQLDLERAEEVMRLFEQREQEIILSQDSVVKPKPVRKLTIEVDTLSLRDSLQVAIPVTMTETPAVRTGLASDTRLVGYPSSITLFLTCGLALLTIIRYNFGKNLLEAFRSFFDYRQSLRLYEERRESDRQAALLSNILFIWVTGIFISIALPFFGANLLWGSYVLSILFFSAVTGLLYILKARIWRSLGVIFMMQNFSKIYIYNMFLYNRNIGLMIFPLVTVIPYVTTEVAEFCMIYSVIAVFAISYLFRMWRIFQIIHTRNVSVFYFILYLCTLEILPLLLLAKACKLLFELNIFL